MTGVDPLTPSAADEPGERGASAASGVPADPAGRPRPLWRRLLGWLLVAATLGFVGLTIARQREQLAGLDWQLEPLPLAGSLVLLIATFAWGVWIWQRVLRRLGVHVRLVPLLRIWFLATLARYVPGKIWQFVGAAQLARAEGIAPLPLVTSMIVNMGFTMAAAALLAAPLVAFQWLGGVAWAVAVGAVAAFAIVVAVHPRIMNFALDLAPRALHRDVLRWDASWGYGVLLLAWSLLSWIAYGAAFTLFAAAIFDIDASVVPGFVAANAVAVLAGILVVVAPAGLGARELTLTAVLEPWLPFAGAAALLALLSRLWVTAGELLGAGLSVLLARLRR